MSFVLFSSPTAGFRLIQVSVVVLIPYTLCIPLWEVLWGWCDGERESGKGFTHLHTRRNEYVLIVWFLFPNQKSQNQILKFFPDSQSWNYLVGIQERLNRGILGCNPLNRNWVPTFDNPHLSLELVSSILESRRNVCVQGSGDGNDNSCHRDYRNGNTSNHLECRILVLENSSFGFPLECPSSGKPFIPLEDSIDSIHSCRGLHSI